MINRINTKIENMLDEATSSMWAFWALLAFILMVLKLNPPTNLQNWALDLLSIAFQTLMLIVLQSKGKRVEKAAKSEGEATRQLVQETHDIALAEHAETQEILTDMRELLAKRGK